MPRLRILYVDDEADIREVVALSLGLDSDVSVCSCASGTEALAMAADWSPDVILCDVVMPGLNGPATLARLREHPRTIDTPFIFMTSKVQAREIEHFKSLGAIGVIVKPFDPMTLAATVRSHLQSAGVAAMDPARPIADDLGQRSGASSWNDFTPHFDRAAATP
jgi:two-component system OmpR family response regulator